MPVGLNAKSCLLEVGSVDRQLPVEAGVQLGGQTLLDQLLLTRCLEEKAMNFLFASKNFAEEPRDQEIVGSNPDG